MHKRGLCFHRNVVALFFVFLVAGSAVGEVPSELFNGLKWRLIGPFRGGRAVAVGGVPGDSTTFYFGGVNGGVWKTTDAGMVWTPIFDGQPVGVDWGDGGCAFGPSKTIYVGTGESDIRSNLAFGQSAFINLLTAESTWTHIGLEDTRHISRIVVDPQNADVVYVGALGHAYGPNEERGVYKSVDGGAHWARVLDAGSGDRDFRSGDLCGESADVVCRERGIRIVRRGALMLLSMGRGAGFIGHGCGEEWTRLRGMDCRMAIGDAWGLMLLRMGSGYMR